MHAEIITIGDEILIGQIVDTNSAFIASELNKIGISVFQITSVQDDRDHILKALEEASSRAQIILMTGGLGPTKDDITKLTLCEYFEDSLVQDPDVLKNIEYLFKTYISTPISEVNRRQAMVPTKARVLPNAHGTAPGMWFEHRDRVFISLPGVPFEMKELLTKHVLPAIVSRFSRPYILHKTLMTYGLGESAIAERISDIEDSLPPFIKMAYLPNLGKVRLRLTAKGADKAVLENGIREVSEKLYATIGDIISGEEDAGTLEAVVGQLLTSRQMTMATAESFTGGRIAEQITSVPGASAYFVGGMVTYATRTKTDLLKVSEQLIREHSVVSAEVASVMAENVRKIMGSDFGIATTGNAGPTKGDSDAPVGTVFIAVASEKGTVVESFSMGNHRVRIVQKGVHKALEMLRKEILKF
ncbi:nicotinamide-nucleotide amidase [Muriicola jejuensis]|uniref:CinA-like protein n=1 Tax=Muriicola jejuensis TaxID=504488 RepID=A0A6P0UG99_9FLAO|nr:competence/damage-inducible protein A [Muriicola jejuensis]NER09146.1 competence/damage-inducible protein A [Muriicola jejuensis]SMP10757.1 nicotinamide-nucleotide amidase [Muriicola jejuensis]